MYVVVFSDSTILFLPVKTGIIVYILSFLAYPLVSSPRWAVNMEKCSVSLELSKLYTTPCPSATSKSHKCQQKPLQRQALTGHKRQQETPQRQAPTGHKCQQEPPQRQAPTGHKHQQVTCASRNPRSPLLRLLVGFVREQQEHRQGDRHNHRRRGSDRNQDRHLQDPPR